MPTRAESIGRWAATLVMSTARFGWTSIAFAGIVAITALQLRLGALTFVAHVVGMLGIVVLLPLGAAQVPPVLVAIAAAQLVLAPARRN